MASTIEILKEYQAHGWDLSPVEAGGKRLHQGWEPFWAESDGNWNETCLKFAEQYPDANWAVFTTGRLLVVDCDTPAGEALVRGLIPYGLRVPAVRTPGSSGVHLYFKSPVQSFVNEGRPVPGVDIRADGGAWVVIPPSVGASGKPYTWEVPLDGDLPEIPPPLLEWLTTNFKTVEQGGYDYYDDGYYDDYGNEIDDEDYEPEPIAQWVDEVWECKNVDGKPLITCTILNWTQWPGQDVGEADCAAVEYRFGTEALTEAGVKFINRTMDNLQLNESANLERMGKRFIDRTGWYEKVYNPGEEDESVHQKEQMETPSVDDGGIPF